ncbi:MAG TPA: ethanolamine ammonia-lyase reactivating factor EutA [Pirellulales bacterium]|nr:ethanolamine ammonia-lyase reactivating factor EutA [Pirellulales bacterium]
MSERVTLIGLDFGTTTSCAVVASARVACNSLTGRIELSDVRQEYQSGQIFTPLVDDRLDEAQLGRHLDAWLGQVDAAQIFGGGAVLTGLAAQKSNAAAFIRQTRQRLANAVIAVGEDPRLESWLAFMGNCADLSRANPDRMFINLDIGGGSTNLAAGRHGEVLQTGSYFVGARHVQLAPGGYQITRLSPYASTLFEHLGIAKTVGQRLDPQEVARIVDWYARLLEDAVGGKLSTQLDAASAMHEQVPFQLPPAVSDPALTLSGGVGQLVYGHLHGDPWPPTTAFGDLGVDLARGLAERPFWQRHLQAFVPTSLGHATVYGLLRYNTQASGSTIYLSDPSLLPLSDLMILGTISPGSSAADIERLIGLASQAAGGACLRIELPQRVLAEIRELAARLRQAIADQPLADQQPLVLLLRENLGKVLGQYLTDWGQLPWKVVVLDEIDQRDAQFAHLGALRQGVVPVSFYGASLGDKTNEPSAAAAGRDSGSRAKTG